MGAGARISGCRRRHGAPAIATATRITSRRASMPARRRACWRCATASPTAGCRSGRGSTCPEWNNSGRASAPIEPCERQRSRRLGGVVLLHPHQSARAGVDAPARRRRHRACTRQRRRPHRGLPDRPVARFALARTVRRIDPRVRESRLRARRHAQGRPPADAAGALVNRCRARPAPAARLRA